MDDSFLFDIEKRRKAARARSRRRWILIAIALLVALVTASALILPAITESNPSFCGMDEHIHGDGCYRTDFICQYVDEAVTETDVTAETVEITDTTVTETETLSTDSEEIQEPATELHTHTEECYQSVLVCELTEHSHTLACLSDPTADVESEEIWSSTVSTVTLTGKPGVDLLAVAKTQLGYTESTANYTVCDDGVTVKGYNRYGAWIGDAYCDWNTAFVSFCTSYADITDMPCEKDAACWVAKLQENSPDLFVSDDTYTAGPGDIVVLDNDGNGTYDTLAVVLHNTDGIITAIEGDVNGQVTYTTYNADDTSIVGYVSLCEPEVQEEEAAVYSPINVEGTAMYHSADNLEYQYSAHRVNNYMALTYVLILKSDYDAGIAPNPKEWSAKADANYVVTYCADRETDVSENGEGYVTEEIENSSYVNYSDILSGIVENSYPFLTADEMRARLAEAYEAGEISIDLSCCNESDYIAATQWAIWDMTGLSGTQTNATGYTFPSYNSGALNPLSDPGHTDATEIQTHVKAIRDWLVTRRAPVKLAVLDHKPEIKRNADGTYDVSATVYLNRETNAREIVVATMTAGEKSVEKTISDAEISEFSIELENLTAYEAIDAMIDLDIKFERIQVYIYDSENYQDMISGQWGIDNYSLEFNVELEKTSVDVNKVWEDGIPGAEYVEVQLFANGEEYGDPVQLNEANDWSFSWPELLKYSDEGVLIEYTIKETPVSGYYSSVTKEEGGKRVVITAEPASLFTEGGQYILTYEDPSVNALNDESGDGAAGLDWVRNTDLSLLESIPKDAVWVASGVSSDGISAYLRNSSTGNYMSYNGSNITLAQSASAKAYFLYNHFYFLNGNYNQYMIYLYGGYGYTTTGWNDALSVNLYRLTETITEAADICFTITNTKAEELTSISVKKEWQGKNDGIYPESATVVLQQNGTSYGVPIVLNEANGWSYTWNDLPVKLGTQTFSYTVEEVPIDGYTPTYSSTTLSDGGIEHTVINTWSPEYTGFKLVKVAYHDTSIKLPDAVFRLYRSSDVESAVVIPGTEYTGILEQTLTVGADGTLDIENILEGETYCLVETDAPEGYNTLKETVVFSIDKDDGGNEVMTVYSGNDYATAFDDTGQLVLQVKNEKGYILPATGGHGPFGYYLIGMLLIIFAASYIIKKIKNNIFKGETP